MYLYICVPYVAHTTDTLAEVLYPDSFDKWKGTTTPLGRKESMDWHVSGIQGMPTVWKAESHSEEGHCALNLEGMLAPWWRGNNEEWIMI